MTIVKNDYVFHLDKGKVNRFEVTAQNFLKLYGTVATEGILEYPQADGTIKKEYVPPETLFDSEHIESTNSAPITLYHPPNGIEVTPNTYKEFSIGTVKKVICNRRGKSLDVELLICREDGILAIQNGITALSMGYRALVDDLGNNEFIQTKRICNHIAVVRKGRAEGAKLHFDSMDNELRYFFMPENFISTVKAKL
jgi:hypothetical protein